MKLRNSNTGALVVVTAITDHPTSSSGKAGWVDEDGRYYCEQGEEHAAGYEVVDQRRELGQRLKEIREEKGLNKNHFRKRGLRFETIGNIEEGANNYMIDSLLDYLEILGVDLAEILLSPSVKSFI